MALINKYKKGGVSIIPEGGWENKFDKEIGGIDNYINKDYGDNEDYAILSLAKLSNNDLKKYLFNKVKNVSQDYINRYNDSPDQDTWKNVSEVNNLLSNINNIDSDNMSEDDWNKVVSFSGSLGWDLPSFFSQTDEQEKEQIALSNEEAKRTSQLARYSEFGISDEAIQNDMYQGGFTKINEGLDLSPAEYIKEKGYNYFRNDDGTTLVFDSEGKLVKEGFGLLTEDQFSEDYGKIFNISEGILNIDQYSDRYKELLPKFEDLGNIRRRLNLSEDSDLNGYEIYGDSSDDFHNEPTYDLFGRRDYTSRITLTKDGEQINATRRDDGSYITEDGEVINPSFTGYGEEFEKITPTVDQALFDNPNLPNWSRIDGKNPNSWIRRFARSAIAVRKEDPLRGTYDGRKGVQLSLDNLDNQLKKIEQDIIYADQTGIDVKSDVANRSKKIGQFLRYYIELGEDPNATPEQKAQAEEAFKLSERLSKVWATKDKHGNQLITFRREGGTIRKLQTGDALSNFLEDSKKFGNSTRKSGITGTRSGDSLREVFTNPGQNLGHITSLVGTGLSFAPGLGVLGGAMSTVGDAVQGAKDGWDSQDTKNLFANLGFTALGVVGLGGAAKLGMKTLQNANKIDDVSRLAVKALNKSKKLSKAGPGAKGVSEAAKRFSGVVEKLGKKGDDFAAISNKLTKELDAGKKISGYKGSAKEILEQFTSDATLASEIASMPTSWINQQGHFVKQGFESLGKTIPKVGKLGLQGYQIYQGGAGAVGIGQSIGEHGLWKGLGEANVHDVRRVGQLGAATTAGVRNFRLNKAINKNTSVVNEATSTLNVGGDSPIQVKGQLSIPKVKSLPKRMVTKSADEAKVGKSKLTSKQFDELSENLAKLLGKDSDNFKGALEVVRTKGVSGLNYKFTPGSGLRLNDAPLSNNFSDIRAYNRAARALKIDSSNTARLSWLKSRNNSTEPTESAKPTTNSTKPVKPVKPTKPVKSVKVSSNSPANLLGKRGSDVKIAMNKPVKTKELSRATKKLIKNYYKGSNVPKEIIPSRLQKSSNLYKALKSELVPMNKKGGVIMLNKGGWFNRFKTGIIAQDINNFNNPFKQLTTFSSNSDENKPAFINPNQIKQHKVFDISNYSTLQESPTSNPEIKSEIPSTIDDYSNEDFRKKPFLNLEPAANLIKYGIGERYNNKVTDARIKAALQTPRLNTRSQTYLSTSLPNTLKAQELAGNLRGQGRRFANSTSDFNAAANISMEANRRALGIEGEGFAQDMNANNAVKLEQARLNSEVDNYNRQVEDKNSMYAAQSWRDVFNSAGNHWLQEGHNKQTLAESIYKSSVTHPYKKMAWDYYQEMQDPNIQSDTDRYNYLASDEVRDTYKAQYENELEQARIANPNVVDPGWENSEQYRAWQQSMKEFKKSNLDPRYSRLSRILQGMQIYQNSAMFQRGGRIPFVEKAALENIKYNNKRLLEYERNYYKNILKKEELLQRAMVKVFK